MRTAKFVTVSAPFGLTIGGALELTMYAHGVQACVDMRASLPELAVGILPDLGGTSELYARCIDDYGAGNEMQALADAFRIVTQMTASRDAESARKLHFLRERDRVSESRQTLLADAKAMVLDLARDFETRAHRRNIPVLGDHGYDALSHAVDAAVQSGAATPYDGEIARAIARIMTGGPGPARTVDHEELLDLETRYFETLVFQPKTRERMEHMLANGTPLRN